ncbi:lysophospholipid acyltransferase family protein [Henriciella litoralis]|uniref:lysophospholipid acyltransferase family protein n=1 Tax=Henriciella litoralis TaxID=568102 RepID=UPI0009FBB9CA|nr:lysophospholipid acyltransferase family protein [Henriciella litoralis]
MKWLFRNPIFSSALGYLIWAYMVLCARTMRWSTEGEEQFREAWSGDRGLIVAAWHSRILLLPSIWTRFVRKMPAKAHPTAMMISLSRDGEFVAQAVSHLGIDVVRGSSTHKKKKKDKGGSAAIMETTKRLRAGSVVCLTPDGPRGPAEQAQAGPVILAQRSNALIIPYALDCKPAFRLKTWDRFMVPIPFAKGTIVLGQPLEFRKGQDTAECTARLNAEIQEAYGLAAKMLTQRN